jgi:hypothetical protein
MPPFMHPDKGGLKKWVGGRSREHVRKSYKKCIKTIAGFRYS